MLGCDQVDYIWEESRNVGRPKCRKPLGNDVKQERTTVAHDCTKSR